MIRVLFESPLWLVLTLVPLLFVAWGVWYRTRRVAAARVLLAAVILALLLLVLQALVVTDAEQLQRLTRRLSSAVERGDVSQVLDLMDPQARFDDTHDLDQVEEHLAYLLEKYSVEKPSVFGFQITIDGDAAVLLCAARCTVKTRDWTYPVRSRWEVHYSRTADGWLISDLKPLQIEDLRPGSIFGIR